MTSRSAPLSARQARMCRSNVRRIPAPSAASGFPITPISTPPRRPDRPALLHFGLGLGKKEPERG